MRRIRSTLCNHRHFLIIVTLLTLATTYPTIVYVFNTDVFWHPGGSSLDTYIEFWDIWYGKMILTGQADRFYTDLMYYPEGLSLATHPIVIPFIIVVNALNILLPVSNAYSLAVLLMIFICALSAYPYLLWLFKNKWIALFGAVVFGFSPHVTGHLNQPGIASIASIPLALYCIHRGINEDRPVLVILAGLLTGLTTVVTLYIYVNLLTTLGFYVVALAIARWRYIHFWLYLVLLGMAITVSSIWRVYPLLVDAESLNAAAQAYGDSERASDAISFFINHKHPLLGHAVETLLKTPSRGDYSPTSFLGYAPLLLISFGLLRNTTRRKMLPWAMLCAAFLLLRLGSDLDFNGISYPEILLPKYYVNQIVPVVFEMFWDNDFFMMGAILPLSILACYGLVALTTRFPLAAKPAFILALIAIVGFEYHIPVSPGPVELWPGVTMTKERYAFRGWLDQEDGEIRLINQPMGRRQSKIYNFYQSVTGYAHAEGFISRRPDSAYRYIRANFLLNAWRDHAPVNCEIADRDTYLAALDQLERDGFSHVVYHHGFQRWEKISASFRGAEPSYQDEFVSIYRLGDLRDGCTGAAAVRHPFTWTYADAMDELSIIAGRHGTLVVFSPTLQAGDHFRRYLRHFTQIDRPVLTVGSDQDGTIVIQNFEADDSAATIDLEWHNALWLVSDRGEFPAEQTEAYQAWFTKRYKPCGRVYEGERSTIDAYLKVDIPCSALDQSSRLEIQYDRGVRLHNASYAVKESSLNVYLAWTRPATPRYSFSLQFFDESGNKALQYDNVISSQLLAVHDIDISSLVEGAYSIQLIAYSYETRKSLDGTVIKTGQRFERELEIATIEV